MTGKVYVTSIRGNPQWHEIEDVTREEIRLSAESRGTQKISLTKKDNNMANEVMEDLETRTSNMDPTHKEGAVAKAIESETAKLPSDLFLWASVGAMATSLTLKLMGKNRTALFIGQWTAPFLLLGIYNKIVKVEGHDKEK